MAAGELFTTGYEHSWKSFNRWTTSLLTEFEFPQTYPMKPDDTPYHGIAVDRNTWRVAAMSGSRINILDRWPNSTIIDSWTLSETGDDEEYCCAFKPDGTLAIAGKENQTIKYYDSNYDYDSEAYLPAGITRTQSMYFDKDGRLYVSRYPGMVVYKFDSGSTTTIVDSYWIDNSNFRELSGITGHMGASVSDEYFICAFQRVDNKKEVVIYNGFFTSIRTGVVWPNYYDVGLGDVDWVEFSLSSVSSSSRSSSSSSRSSSSSSVSAEPSGYLVIVGQDSDADGLEDVFYMDGFTSTITTEIDGASCVDPDQHTQVWLVGGFTDDVLILARKATGDFTEWANSIVVHSSFSQDDPYKTIDFYGKEEYLGGDICFDPSGNLVTCGPKTTTYLAPCGKFDGLSATLLDTYANGVVWEAFTFDASGNFYYQTSDSTQYAFWANNPKVVKVASFGSSTILDSFAVTYDLSSGEDPGPDLFTSFGWDGSNLLSFRYAYTYPDQTQFINKHSGFSATINSTIDIESHSTINWVATIYWTP
jgi:hypothetical protein